MTQFKNYRSTLCLDLFFIYGRFILLGSNTIFLFIQMSLQFLYLLYSSLHDRALIFMKGKVPFKIPMLILKQLLLLAARLMYCE